MMHSKEKEACKENPLLNTFRYFESDRFMKLVEKYPLSLVDTRITEKEAILIAEEIAKVLRKAFGAEESNEDIVKSLSMSLRKERRWKALSDSESIIHVYNKFGNASLVYLFPITKEEVSKLKQKYYCDHPDPNFIFLERTPEARLDGDVCAKFSILHDPEHRLLEVSFRAYSKTYDEKAIETIYENLKIIDGIIGERHIKIPALPKTG
jgi:hypothetical protein